MSQSYAATVGVQDVTNCARSTHIGIGSTAGQATSCADNAGTIAQHLVGVAGEAVGQSTIAGHAVVLTGGAVGGEDEGGRRQEVARVADSTGEGTDGGAGETSQIAGSQHSLIVDGGQNLSIDLLESLTAGRSTAQAAVGGTADTSVVRR